MLNYSRDFESCFEYSYSAIPKKSEILPVFEKPCFS